MPKVSRQTTPEVVDEGPFEDRIAHLDGYTVNFTSIREDGDLAPLLVGLPDDRCQCAHWGYVFSGRLTFTYADGVDVIEAGEAYYIPPGHTPAAAAGTEFLMISPQEEMARTDAAMRRNLERMQAGS
jgi:hypothetical protein